VASLEIVPDDDVLGAFIGSRLPQARYVEFGARKSPARPYLFPALEARKHFIRGDIEQSVRRTLGIVSGAFLPVDRLGFPKLTGDPEVDSILIWAFRDDLRRRYQSKAATDPNDDGPTLMEQARELARELEKSFDRFLTDASNAPGDPPDFPPTLPPRGGMIRLPRGRR